MQSICGNCVDEFFILKIKHGNFSMIRCSLVDKYKKMSPLMKLEQQKKEIIWDYGYAFYS